MLQKQNTPHPYLISNWTKKTQAKIGSMLMDIVSSNGKLNDSIEISGIVQLGKKYRIGDKTFVKYLKKSIFSETDKKNNTKTLYLSKTDIILIKEIMYLQERYYGLEQAQKNIIRCLIAKLGKML